ncbi:MAG: hypothetical protein PHV53_11115 [Fermentimonas sp.]|nr:hypothetical protein [Fermentimonas sp.]
MAIIQKPDALSLSGNMNKFIVSSGSQIAFKLSEGATTLLEASYEPGPDGRATIDVKDIVESRLSYIISHTDFYEQTNIVKTFTAIIDGATVTFRVIRGGVANLADTSSNFLRDNFLTWQPTNKKVTYYSPEWLTYYAQEACSIKLKATFPDAGQTLITLGSCDSGKAFTCNLQYAVVAGLLAQTYPTHYDVWVENTAGLRLSYIQRYLYSEPKTEAEQWFLFENSLGGLDTLRASGDTDFTGDHEHKLSSTDNISKEYQVDTGRFYKQNTGYLDEYERRWLLDLFPATQKYIYHVSAIRPIVVTGSDVKYSAVTLPSEYNFTYRFTNDSEVTYLNLIRNLDQIPESITIPDISSPDFHLPPRLSEYPRVPLHEGVIIPAFDPNSTDPKVTTVGALLQVAVYEVFQKIEAGEGGGELVNIIRSNSSEGASDFTVFSSLRTLYEIEKYFNEHSSDKYISKIHDDIAQGLIRFLAGLEIGEFIPGMFGGKGARIDKDGNIEATSLRLRALLEVPELRYNRITIVGDEMVFTEGGLIESVEYLVDRSYQLNMKIEEGDAVPFSAGSLIKGIFHHSTGFATSYMRVEEVGQTFMKITLAADTDIPTPYNLPPQPFMTVARVGHITDPEKQRYVVASSKLGGIQVMDGCSDFLNGYVAGSMDIAQSFKSQYGNLPLREGLFYLYSAGIITQDIIRVGVDGRRIREVYDRGTWQAGVTYYNNDERGTDDVWHLGCRWRCFSASTTEEPSWTSAAWYMIEGRSDVRMEFDSSAGYAFTRGNVNTDIMPVVFIGNANVSADIVAEQWKWMRESGDPTADLVWNTEHVGIRVLLLRNEDMGINWSKTNPVRFICEATYPASSINPITNYLEV